jgi:putative ABC transport system permease protein
VYLRLLWHSLARQKGHRALAALAISLGVASLTALLSLGLVVGDRVAAELRSYGANIRVEPRGEELPLEVGGVDLRPLRPSLTLPVADLARLRRIFWRNNIVALAPFLPLRRTEQGRTFTLLGTWFDHRVDERFTTGLPALARDWRLRGRWPREGAREVVLGAALARRLGLAPGGLLAGLRVTGVYESGGPEDEQGYLPLDVAGQMAGLPGRYRWAVVSAITTPEERILEKYGLDPRRMSPQEYDRWYCTPYVSSIAHQIMQALPGSSASAIRQVTEGDERVLLSLRQVMWAVGLAVLVAAGLAVGSAMAATLQERRVEMALLRTLGAGRRGVAALFVGESAFLGLAGGLAGFFVGSALADRMGRAIFGSGIDPQWALLPPVLLAAVILAGVGTGLVLRRVLADAPAAVLRGGA